MFGAGGLARGDRSMPWWGWIVIGSLLFGAELFAIDTAFYLIFIGAAAFTVGLVGMIGFELPTWGQWLFFAILSVTSMFTFRRRLYDRIRGEVPGVVHTMVGERILLEQELKAGATCRTGHRGSTWTAINVGDELIPSGSNATIEAIEGLTLKIRIPDS